MTSDFLGGGNSQRSFSYIGNDGVSVNIPKTNLF